MIDKLNSFEAYQQAYEKSIINPEEFWSIEAERFKWKKKMG